MASPNYDPDKSAPFFDCYRKDFLDYLEVELHRSPATILSYGKDLRYFSEYLRKQGIGSLSEITLPLLKDYIQYLSAKKRYKPRSLAHTIATFKTFFDFLVLEEILTENPAKRLAQPRIPHNLPRYLDQPEVEQLIESVDDGSMRGKRDRAILATMFYSGLRLAETVALQMDDVSLEEGTLEVQHGKGDKYRVVPIHPKLQAILRDYLDHIRPDTSSPYFFPGVRGHQLGKSTVRLIVYRAAKTSELHKSISPHVLRHSIASRLAQVDDVDILDISKFLGHSRLSTTKIYLHADLKHLREAIERLPVLWAPPLRPMAR
ncbi:tyrosine-type recombinase/integrase [Heliobacillus mobilis]|uniref:Tyrosine-type recombinase/integrase n=1 Tax=Heliobacterium mobile TaxID=28064 RepID=A0A6I3SLQ6_HELMO|nr:tyrosine-type recombinase/integrase [Heliobacterium mobile]MTV49891.1 tyrosine-type recombinase/integrase [Heliobacterium mobile]